MQENNKVTIYDIAQKIGVSASTVSRAINGKKCVNEETKELVLKTAEEMGYRANKVAMGLTRKPIRIGFMVNEKILEYQNKVLDGAKKACDDLSDYNVEGIFYMIPRDNCRQRIIDKLYELADEEVNGIVFSPASEMGFEHVLQDLKEKNIPVATVITDVSHGHRIFSVRPNGRMAGKIAAELFYMMGLREKDEVAIFTGSLQTEIHRAYIDGFLEANQDNKLELVNIVENYDDPRIAYLSVETFLTEYPNVKGIYINTANSVAVCKRITELGYAHRVKIIATDLFPGLVEYMSDRTICATIFQDPYLQGNLAFKEMYKYIVDKKLPESNILISPKIVIKTNISDYDK